MTLDELLALLPDNTTGEISPADMRTIVTDLFNAAHTLGDSYAYRWSSSPGAQSAGHVSMDQPWLTFATKIQASETTDDGLAPGFATVDNAIDGKFWISNASGSKIEGNILGPSVDMGTWREIPVQIVSIIGPAPANNSQVTVTLAGVL